MSSFSAKTNHKTENCTLLQLVNAPNIVVEVYQYHTKINTVLWTLSKRAVAGYTCTLVSDYATPHDYKQTLQISVEICPPADRGTLISMQMLQSEMVSVIRSTRTHSLHTANVSTSGHREERGKHMDLKKTKAKRENQKCILITIKPWMFRIRAGLKHHWRETLCISCWLALWSIFGPTPPPLHSLFPSVGPRSRSNTG